MSDHTINDWINAQGSPGVEATIVKDYVGTIELGIYSVPILLRDLEPFITTNEDMINVARALALLPPIFNALTVEVGRTQIHALVEYFCTRLINQDQIHNFRAGIKEVSACLIAIARWAKFPPGDATLIVRAICDLADASTFKDQKPDTRAEIYRLVQELFGKYKTALVRDIGTTSLIGGLVGMAELEKNPKCLGVLFPIYAEISQSWDLKNTDLTLIWDSFFRYFPITQTGAPASQDPTIPSTEKLKDLLLQCILSNNFYAAGAFQRFSDLLDQSSDLSANTKKEMFSTFVACVTSYPADTISEWAPKIWDSLKFEVWNGENEDFVEGSLKVLHAMTLNLAQASHDELLENHLSKFVVPAMTECATRLHEARHFTTTSKIMFFIATASPYAFSLVIKTVMPSMFVIWQDLRLGSEKNTFLKVFNSILTARLSQPDAVNAGPDRIDDNTTQLMWGNDSIESMATRFTAFRDSLVEIYLGILAPLDLDLAVPAIHGLAQLFKIPHYLEDSEKGMVARTLIENLQAPYAGRMSDAEIRAEALSALEQITAVEPDLFKSITLPSFLNYFPLVLSGNEAESIKAQEIMIIGLQELTDIACTSPCMRKFAASDATQVDRLTSSYWHRNFETTMTALLDKITLIQDHYHKGDSALKIITILAAAILRGLEMFDKGIEKARARFAMPEPGNRGVGPYTFIVQSLFNNLVMPLGTREHWPSYKCHAVIRSELADEKLVELVGQIALVALRSRLTTDENNFVLQWNATHTAERPNFIHSLFINEPEEVFLEQPQSVLVGKTFKSGLANVLSMYLVAGLKKDAATSPGFFDIGRLGNAMLREAITPIGNPCEFARLAMLHIVQLLVNKFGAAKKSVDETVPEVLLRDIIVAEVASAQPTAPPLVIRRTYQALAYFTAAAAACSDPSTTTLIDLMISAIAHPGFQRHSRQIAQSFRILLAPSEIINQENFCTIRPLRKQRLFHLVVDRCLDLWQQCQEPEIKQNYLIAIAGVLNFMDAQQLTAGDVSARLLPVILLGTNVQNDDFAKSAYIQNLLAIIPECKSIITEHLDSIITRMIDRTHNTYDNPSDGSVKCRVGALKVLLALIRSMDANELRKRKGKLLVELDFAKDDCSYEVRSMAAECRLAWLYLEGEKES